ncbi:hypothetical protein [Chitinolyticbacter meiyuanensis]|uniref:hypothetical protein n=1 Tax=Chitinolyticbacter meiyuanensis TaxID=682798 RepID=UPI001651CB44|nr:hypothetical protein [Chitinolyticbacter meiyuanensis]
MKSPHAEGFFLVLLAALHWSAPNGCAGTFLDISVMKALRLLDLMVVVHLNDWSAG